MCYYRDLISTSDWSCHKENFLQPIRSTTHIRIVTRSVSVEFVGSFLRTDIISRGNRRCREMLDVFPGLLNITALQKLSFLTCLVVKFNETVQVSVCLAKDLKNSFFLGQIYSLLSYIPFLFLFFSFKNNPFFIQ